jgi:SAM-dependent methyltransferase
MKNHDNINNPEFWESRYNSRETGWDLGQATPVFEEISQKIKPGRICILGCGNGYDAMLFSRKGFDVTAVDFAPTPIRRIKKAAKKQSLNISTVQDDIFNLSSKYKNSFDYIVEQTCFCAIDPLKRLQYSCLAYDILKTGGQLIGLWMPLDKDIKDGGPPFGVEEKEVKHLFSKNWIIKEDRFPSKSIEPRKGREKLIIFQKS